MLKGQIKNYKVKDQQVEIIYENGKLDIYIITDSIIRILNPIWMENYQSVAVEVDKTIETSFDSAFENGCVEIKTKKSSLRIGENGSIRGCDADGLELLKTYNGKRSFVNRLSEKDIISLEAEGHKFKNSSDGDKKVQILFELNDGDCFYGLGDKTGYLNKRGYQYENWNSDIPDIHHENMPALYKSIPFVIGTREGKAFGLFFDNTFHSYLDFGKEDPSYYFYGADEGNLDIYFMASGKMANVIKDYTYLTGRTPLPTLWSLGYHQCRWGYECSDDIKDVANKMRENKIPCESVQYDIDYMDGFRVFTWNKNDYGDASKLFTELGEEGFKPIVIIDPGTKKDENYYMYQEGIKNDYFAHGADGSVYENAVWPGTSVYPDFGRAEVRKWWADSHRFLTDLGVKGVWNDMNEPASFNGPLPLDVQFSVNDRMTNHSEAHNTYGHFMSKSTYSALKEQTGERPLVITRACYSGTQKYSTVWTGDNQSVWSHLKMLIPQLCNLGMSGFAIAGTDIGGFGGDTNPELLCRWIEAAAFSTFFRNHSAKGTRRQEPWQFGQRTVDIYRKYVELHYQFLPYIYDILREGLSTGLPVMRPLVLHYENDANTYNLNDEFMVGDSVLVAPVVEQGATKRMVYFPEGTWIDYWTKNRIQGGQYLVVDAPLEHLPLYIKNNSIIPNYEVVSYVGQKPYTKLKLLVAGTDANYLHYQDNGLDFAYENGEYNLYKYETNSSGTLSEKLIHNGYEPYREVEVIKL